MTAEPCVICGGTGGAMCSNTHRAARISLEKYGVPGVGCHACYTVVRYRVRRGFDPVDGPSPAPVPPCVVCGTPSGPSRVDCRRPARLRMERFGVPGLGCRRCYDAARKRATRVEAS